MRTAIDDATRVRALKIFRRHTRPNASDFNDSGVMSTPSWISLESQSGRFDGVFALNPIGPQAPMGIKLAQK